MDSDLRRRTASALLRLETTSLREGLLDGAWWPRTRDIETELPALISLYTTDDAAREAMTRAVRADNITRAAQILIATTSEPEGSTADTAG
ncbi:DUF5994 family protein [Streptomyces sp. NPDC088762]|uniref:DUF5994 family protein n=1 Tax=Streptomyces sp. NPDC088762 TaxID=3365891 RepID=UPI0037FC12B3